MTEDDPHDPERSTRDARERGSEPDSGPPPHPMDRIWAHPSELGSAVGDPATPIPSRRPSWGVAVIAAACGVAATLAIVMLAGGFDGDSGARTASDLVPAFPELGVDRTAGIVATVSSSIVAIRVVHSSTPEATPATGTGVVLGDDRILTNASLVEVGDTITVTTADGTVGDARLLGRDRATDLAVLDAPKADAPSVRLGSSDGVTVGTWVLAVGASAGQRRWASQGIVSGVDVLVAVGSGELMSGMLGTDLGTEPGSDRGAEWGGGPLLDADGAVIAIVSRAAPGHAVPIDVARSVAGQLAASGRVRHGWLGALAVDAVARTGGGALVDSVAAGGPAEVAGLAARDIVTAVGAAPITDVAALMAVIARLRPGDPVRLTIWRDGQRRRIDVSLGERSDDAAGLAALQA